MTLVHTDRPTDARTLMEGNPAAGMPAVLVIAAGTPYEILVRDARSIYRWSKQTVGAGGSGGRLIVYHHTAGGTRRHRTMAQEINALMEMAASSDFGLPYNFITFPSAPHRIYYLNDVDKAWPHTYGKNWATAIAAYGNYSVDNPPAKMVGRMTALADALASMWGRWVPESQHRDHWATECPGHHLSGLLPSLARQRD